ncbi:MAG TPA: arylsulfatase [Candidatus Marinimicrobia bacterium]|nr:MAG: arylsulfatase [Verrucomicrobiales bacterium]HIC51818.1 arylsulfatase [Candidatus Neomarinimicrobiota bacterium]
MKSRLIILVALISTVICNGSNASDATISNPPNIVFIFTDDLGYNNLSCYGAPKIKTPIIDQMAKEGIRFTDFYAGSSVCTPSRYALLTGRYPHRAKDKAMLRWLNPKHDTGGISDFEITVAQALRDSGYATACIGKWHLGDSEKFFPTKFGFDYWWGLANNPYHSAYSKGVPLYENTKIAIQPANLNTLTKSYTEKAIGFIEKSVKEEKPFFLYLPHTYPHGPLACSEEFRGKSAGGLLGDTIEEIDWSTGQILKKLKDLGIDSNTMVIFTSDNGPGHHSLRKPNQSAYPLRRGKASVYEGGIRVPCIVRWPGKIEGNRIEAKSGIMMDWFPTFMAMTGGSMPADRPHDGRDLSDLLFNSGDRSDSEFYANFIAGWYGDVKKHVYEIMEHRSGKWKYVALNGGELYNLEKDISETNNVKSANMKIYNRLKKEYDFFTKSIDKAPAPGDIDGDGMPDAYEKANNLDPLYAIDSYLDPDGNGKTAYEEYLEDLTKKRR